MLIPSSYVLHVWQIQFIVLDTSSLFLFLTHILNGDLITYWFYFSETIQINIFAKLGNMSAKWCETGMRLDEFSETGMFGAIFAKTKFHQMRLIFVKVEKSIFV